MDDVLAVDELAVETVELVAVLPVELEKVLELLRVESVLDDADSAVVDVDELTVDAVTAVELDRVDSVVAVELLTVLLETVLLESVDDVLSVLDETVELDGVELVESVLEDCVLLESVELVETVELDSVLEVLRVLGVLDEELELSSSPVAKRM